MNLRDKINKLALSVRVYMPKNPQVDPVIKEEIEKFWSAVVVPAVEEFRKIVSLDSALGHQITESVAHDGNAFILLITDSMRSAQRHYQIRALIHNGRVVVASGKVERTSRATMNEVRYLDDWVMWVWPENSADLSKITKNDVLDDIALKLGDIVIT